MTFILCVQEASRACGQDEVAVPRYFFAIRWPDGRKQDDRDGTFLPNEAAALSYVERAIESLRKGNGYDDPGLMMLVRNERHRSFCRYHSSRPALKGCLGGTLSAIARGLSRP